MPIAPKHERALLVFFLALRCAPAAVKTQHDGGDPWPDATREDAFADLALDEPSLDAAHPGLDQRPRNATCRAPPTPEGMPSHLAETGCFDPNDLRRPGTGLIPYSVKAPLWSDGAAKERYLTLPDEAKIA